MARSLTGGDRCHHLRMSASTSEPPKVSPKTREHCGVFGVRQKVLDAGQRIHATPPVARGQRCMFRVEARAAAARTRARIFGIEANSGIAAGCEWCLWRWPGVGRSDLLATLQGASCRRFAAAADSAAWRGTGSDSSVAAFLTCLRDGWSTGRGDSKSCGTDPGGLLDACVRFFRRRTSPRSMSRTRRRRTCRL